MLTDCNAHGERVNAIRPGYLFAIVHLSKLQIAVETHWSSMET